VIKFFKSLGDGNKAFIAQRHSNRSCWFLEVVEFGSGSRRGLIEILEGLERRGWNSFVVEMRKVVSFFGLPIGKESRILPSC
jgi:hypothetical protein